MKHIKLFENNIPLTYEEVLEANRTIKKIEKLLAEFLKLNKFKNLTVYYGDDNIMVEYTESDGEESFDIIQDDEFRDFKEFIKDPKLWRETKKYNL